MLPGWSLATNSAPLGVPSSEDLRLGPLGITVVIDHVPDHGSEEGFNVEMPSNSERGEEAFTTDYHYVSTARVHRSPQEHL